MTELPRSRLDLRRGTWAQTESGPLVACPECGHASIHEGPVALLTCPLEGCGFAEDIELVEELTPPPEPEPEPAPIPIHNTATEDVDVLAVKDQDGGVLGDDEETEK